MKNLCDASRDELLDEIFTRYEHCAFAGIFFGQDDLKQGASYGVTVQVSGDSFTAAGLAARATEYALQKGADSVIPEEPEDRKDEE